MSQCHDIYDMIRTDAGATGRTWTVRVDLDDIGGIVRARAVLTEDGVAVRGEGMTDSDTVGIEEARCLAVGEALLEVASALIGGQSVAADLTQRNRTS